MRTHEELKDAIICLFMNYLDCDREQALKWLNQENLGLGGATPQKLIDVGRGHKVLRYVEALVDGY